MESRKLIDTARGLLHGHRFAIMAGILVFLLCAGSAELLIRFQDSKARSEERLKALSYASVLRARTDRELNAVMFLTSGLASYLVVRHDQLDPKEINDILAALHGSSHNVRNFGVAIGYSIAYVYPLKGNEKAIGLDYRNVPAQWVSVKRAVETRKGTLSGPVELVQGGVGLIYRQPVFIKGVYWGLLSTVVDGNTFFHNAFDELNSDDYDFAVRGRDGNGAQGEVFWGDPSIFEDADRITLEAEVPNGRWIFAVRPKAGQGHANTLPWITRPLSWWIALLLGSGTLGLLRQRVALSRLALVDSLTGLPNRRLLDDRLEQAIRREAREDGHINAVLFIDLDGFKSINDRYGHKVGDVVLKVIAQRLRHEVRLGDTVARWGGDEMLIVVEAIDPVLIEPLVKRLRGAVAMPIKVDGHTLHVQASIGVAQHPQDGIDAVSLIECADRRMYEEKGQRKRAAADS
jgi:diguanylate cyclase